MDTLCTSGFKTIVQALDNLGIDTIDLLAKSGLSKEDIADPDGRIAVECEARFWGELSQTMGDPLIGITCATFGELGIYPLLDYLSASSDTIGMSLGQIARYIRLVNEAWAPKFVSTDAESFFFADVSCTDPDYRHSVEFGMGLVARRIRLLAGKPYFPVSVSFQHNLVDGTLARYVEIFGCEPSFGCERNSLVYDANLEDLPCIKADPALRDTLDHAAKTALEKISRGSKDRSDSIEILVRGNIREQLAGGEPNIGATAKSLAMSERTLQRRLEEVQLNYKFLVSDVRKQTAEDLLQDESLPIMEVGFLLGYSNTSAFYRAFKTWFGVTPAEFRKQKTR